jgi:hypothetical protein
MGYHYGRPALVNDVNVDPTMPEILVYARDARGSLRLVALEFFRADADGDTTTSEDRPTLFGHPVTRRGREACRIAGGASALRRVGATELAVCTRRQQHAGPAGTGWISMNRLTT